MRKNNRFHLTFYMTCERKTALMIFHNVYGEGEGLSVCKRTLFAIYTYKKNQ